MVRRGIDLLQVQRCLLHGRMTEGPYVAVNSTTGDWRCNLETRIGERIRVVVEIPQHPTQLIVITAIDLE